MLILASTSPRRRELLQSLGLSFTVDAQHTEENVPAGLAPGVVVEMLALRKAQAVADTKKYDGLIIGADTIVVHNGEILGKPAGEKHAKEMLEKLQGDEHYVYSGVAVVNAQNGHAEVTHQKTKVILNPISPEEIEAYVATGEPMDKAGAYAIQGIASIFVAGIEGCYFNVVGLPLERLAYLLKKMGYNVLSNIYFN